NGDTLVSTLGSRRAGVLCSGGAERAQVIDPERSYLPHDEVWHLAQQIALSRRDGINVPAIALVGEFDPRQMIRMAHHENARSSKLCENRLAVSDRRLS